MENNNHEGWRGYRVDQIQDKARRTAATLCPNVFMINAGSNDCIQDFGVELFGKRIDNMLEYFWQTNPHSTIILSTLLENADKEANSRVVGVNNQIRGVVKLKEAEQKKIVLADMQSSAGPQLSNLIDGTHPNNEGYEKMAAIWFNAIQEAVVKGFLTT
jgi:lysophospholipase L1-like esterase